MSSSPRHYPKPSPPRPQGECSAAARISEEDRERLKHRRRATKRKQAVVEILNRVLLDAIVL